MILDGRAETLPSDQLRAGMRGILGRFVDLKSLNGILELSWHTDQLHRVGAGLTPALNCGRIATTLAMLRRNGTSHSAANVGFDVKRYALADKVVLITGAGRGLGAATATALTQRRARVVIADKDLSRAQSVAATMPTRQVLPLQCDVTAPDAVQESVRSTLERFGRIDVVIANAGVLGRGSTMLGLHPDQVAGVMSVNVNGVVNTVSATMDSVIGSRGQIVVVSSVFAYINGAGAIPYAMSKAAVEQLGRGLASSWRVTVSRS